MLAFGVSLIALLSGCGTAHEQSAQQIYERTARAIPTGSSSEEISAYLAEESFLYGPPSPAKDFPQLVGTPYESVNRDNPAVIMAQMPTKGGGEVEIFFVLDLQGTLDHSFFIEYGPLRP